MHLDCERIVLQGRYGNGGNDLRQHGSYLVRPAHAPPLALPANVRQLVRPLQELMRLYLSLRNIQRFGYLRELRRPACFSLQRRWSLSKLGLVSLFLQ